MRARVVIAMAGAALLAAGLLPASGAGADCVWHKHTKRVVKHVRRHGKRVKVVRHKHWWTCDAPGTGAGSGTGGSGGGSTTVPSAGNLGVKAEDTPTYRYTVSRLTVATGRLTVQLNNQGQDPHDLNIQDTSSGAAVGSISPTAPSTQSTSTFNLAPGTYKLYCDIADHDALGMHATLTVTP